MAPLALFATTSLDLETFHWQKMETQVRSGLLWAGVSPRSHSGLPLVSSGVSQQRMKYILIFAEGFCWALVCINE